MTQPSDAALQLLREAEQNLISELNKVRNAISSLESESSSTALAPTRKHSYPIEKIGNGEFNPSYSITKQIIYLLYNFGELTGKGMANKFAELTGNTEDLEKRGQRFAFEAGRLHDKGVVNRKQYTGEEHHRLTYVYYIEK